jgi:hypothetical protein
MTDVEHSPGMPDTGERREITHFVNAKEAEQVQESKKLVSKTKQRSAKAAHQDRSRKRRNVSLSRKEKPRETEDLCAPFLSTGNTGSKSSAESDSNH